MSPAVDCDIDMYTYISRSVCAQTAAQIDEKDLQ